MIKLVNKYPQLLKAEKDNQEEDKLNSIENHEYRYNLLTNDPFAYMKKLDKNPEMYKYVVDDFYSTDMPLSNLSYDQLKKAVQAKDKKYQVLSQLLDEHDIDSFRDLVYDKDLKDELMPEVAKGIFNSDTKYKFLDIFKPEEYNEVINAAKKKDNEDLLFRNFKDEDLDKIIEDKNIKKNIEPYLGNIIIESINEGLNPNYLEEEDHDKIIKLLNGTSLSKILDNTYQKRDLLDTVLLSMDSVIDDPESLDTYKEIPEEIKSIANNYSDVINNYWKKNNSDADSKEIFKHLKENEDIVRKHTYVDPEVYNKLDQVYSGKPIQKHPQEHLLEKLKDYASHTKKGTIDKGTMFKLYPHLKPRLKSLFNAKNEISIDEIDKMLNEGKKTGNKYRLSMDKWYGGLQTSTSGNQDVYQLNIPSKNLTPEELEIATKINRMSLGSSHPVSEHAITKGWVRIDTSNPHTWVIDEIQTDYDRKVRDFMNEHELHDDAETLQGIIDKHKDWKHTLFNHIIDKAKEAGVKKIYIHTPESKAKHVGGDKVHSVWKEQYHKLPREFGFEKVKDNNQFEKDISNHPKFHELVEEHGAYVKNLTPEYHKEKLKSVNPNIVKEDVQDENKEG